MHFDERIEGDFRIYTGAIEAKQGDGYTATLIVQRWRGPIGSTGELLRDEAIACGHRWRTADEALLYAMRRGLDAVAVMIQRRTGTITA